MKKVSKSKVAKPKSKATSAVEHTAEGLHFNLDIPHGLKGAGVRKGKGWCALWSAKEDKSSELGFRLVRELATGLRERDLVASGIPILDIIVRNPKPRRDIVLYKRNLDCVLYDGRVESVDGFINVFVGRKKGTPYRATIEFGPVQR